MSNIFISYRRDDAIQWAGRLYTDLATRFGGTAVFMDNQGGIKAGDRFSDKLNDTLNTCKVLLALIGPKWLSLTERKGMDESGIDWVENEISTAIKRNILIVPVLLGDAKLPEESDLSVGLKALLEQQAMILHDDSWNEGINSLVDAITSKVPVLGLVSDDMASAIGGIGLLKELIREDPAVAESVTRSKEVISNTYRQLSELANLKKIHDALHQIEFLCLHPLQNSCRIGRLCCMQYMSHHNEVVATVEKVNLNDVLKEEILDQMKEVEMALQDAMTKKEAWAVDRALAELNTLIAGVPPRIDTSIVNTAANLNLPRLIALMTTVRDMILPRWGSEKQTEYLPFLASISAIDRLKDNLDGAVKQHSQLQILDTTLRTICEGGTVPQRIEAEWRRVNRLRSKISANPWGELTGQLEELAQEIDSTIGASRYDELPDLFFEYLQCISTVFKSVDTKLKSFCDTLNELSQPLRTVLELC